jgi:hypothetical protein
MVWFIKQILILTEAGAETFLKNRVIPVFLVK